MLVPLLQGGDIWRLLFSIFHKARLYGQTLVNILITDPNQTIKHT